MILKKGPYIQDPKKDSVVIMWETDIASSSKVKVYDTDLPHVPGDKKVLYETEKVYKSEDGMMHKVTVDGLTPGTAYTYEVVSEAGTEAVSSDVYHFSTAPEESSAFSFIVTAEHGGCRVPENEYAPPIINLMENEHPDFILSVGDIVSNGLKEDEWDTYLFTPFKKLLTSTPFYPCIGNHEVCTLCIDPKEEVYRYPYWDRYLAFPHYYSFDYGCAHFCVLDAPAMVKTTNATETDAYLPELQDDLKNTEQYKFLEQDLAAAHGKWLFVVFHYPPYTSSTWDVRELQILVPLFEKYGVDVVFNSHAIVYERSHPIREGRIASDGIRYILAGGYGDYGSWFRDKCNKFSAKISNRPGYIRVSLTEERLELQAIDYMGRLFDLMTLEK